MKKSKLLVGVLVASMALLGTGYAYWSDQLAVSTTVETGKLEVNYVTETTTGTTGELNEAAAIPGSSSQQIVPADEEKTDFFGTKWYRYGWKWELHQRTITVTTSGTLAGEIIVAESNKRADKAKGYIEDVTATAAGKNVTISMKNFYPGSFASASFTAKNDGTIPAQIDTIALSSKLSDLQKKLKVVVKVSEPGIGNLTVASVTQKDIDDAVFLGDIEDVLKTAYSNAKLEPGQMIKAEITIIFPGDGAKNDEFESLTGTLAQTFSLNINWIQHNQLPTSTEE